MKASLIFSGLMLMAIATIASAQNAGAGHRQNNRSGRGSAFTDDNKNGICDNMENRNLSVSGNKGSGNGKTNMRGKGRQHFQGQGRGKYFADVNNNGICDRYETTVKKSK